MLQKLLPWRIISSMRVVLASMKFKSVRTSRGCIPLVPCLSRFSLAGNSIWVNLTLGSKSNMCVLLLVLLFSVSNHNHDRHCTTRRTLVRHRWEDWDSASWRQSSPGQSLAGFRTYRASVHRRLWCKPASLYWFL